MAQNARETMELMDLSKGMNQYDPETKVPAGFYVDAQNMLLLNKSPVTVGGLTKLNTTAAPGDRIVLWAEPYTDSAGKTHILAFLDDGVDGTPDGDGAGLWKYDLSVAHGGTDTWTPVWVAVGSGTGGGGVQPWINDLLAVNGLYAIKPPIISVPFRGRLLIQPTVIVGDSSKNTYPTIENEVRQSVLIPELPLKYDGTYAVPVGAFGSTPEFNLGLTTTGNQTVARFISTEGTWTGAGGTERSGAGERKEGTTSRELVSTGAEITMALDYTSARDFLTGLLGAPDLTTTDLFVIWIRRSAGSSALTIRIRLGNAADTSYFENSTTVGTFANNTWECLAFPRSFFATTGTPVWSSIAKLTVGLTSTNDTVQFDAAYMAYRLSPTTSGRVIEMYNQQLIHAGNNLNPTGIEFSDAGSIDYFDADNTAQFTGGRNALEQADQITALWSYFDELIVGKPNSAWTFSGTGLNTSISALPLTIGIGGSRAISETPWSLHYYYDGNIFGARLTSRGLVSTNITSELSLVDNRKLSGITSIRDDGTHTVRWGFPTQGTGNDENDLGLLYDYQLDAWTSRYTPHVRAYSRWVDPISGIRELLAVQYDGFIRRVDLGTTFDGTAIESYVTLPWTQAPNPPTHDKVVQWMDLTAYLKGTATVNVDARFADEPHEFNGASFTTFGTIGATPDGDKGFVYLGRTSRWIQVRLYAAALSFEIQPPIVIGFNSSKSRV